MRAARAWLARKLLAVAARLVDFEEEPAEPEEEDDVLPIGHPSVVFGETAQAMIAAGAAARKDVAPNEPPPGELAGSLRARRAACQR